MQKQRLRPVKNEPDNDDRDLGWIDLHRYWSQNPTELKERYDQQANSIQTSLICPFFVILFALGTFEKLSYAAFYALVPAFVIAIFPIIGFRRLLFAKYSSLWFGAVLLLGIIGASTNLAMIYKAGLIPDSSMMTTIIFLSIAFPVFPKISHNIALFFLSILASLFIFHHLEVIEKIKSHSPAVVNGVLLGLGSFTYNVIRNYRSFHDAHINKKYNKNIAQEMQKTFYPHQLLLMKMNVPITETMCVDPSMGFACELDIIGSSGHKVKSYFEGHKQKGFEGAYEQINEGYELNNDDLRKPFSSAFKLKEMGDGFLFTVNYPFRLKVQENKADQTIDLCEKILAAIDEKLKDYDSPVHCAIAVTYEQLMGFWTQGLSTTYDIDQLGMTRAARLSNLRKDILADEKLIEFKDAHVILITESVFEMISLDKKRHFQRIKISDYDANKRGFSEREEFIYVKRLSTARSETWSTLLRVD